MALQSAPDQPIDRTTTTPSLLKLFYRQNAFHSASEFITVPPTANLTRSSLQIYTWPNATLSELTGLLTQAVPDIISANSKGTRVIFSLFFPDTRSVVPGRDEGQGRWLSRDVGSVVFGENGEDLTGDANKTLADARFVIGDYISAVISPDGRIPDMPRESRGGPGGYRGRGQSYGHERRGGGRFGNSYGRPPTDGNGSVPNGDWRRGERLPDDSSRGGRYRDRRY